MRTSIPIDNFFPPEDFVVGVEPPLCEVEGNGWLRTRTVLNSSNAVVGSVKPSNPNLGLMPRLIDDASVSSDSLASGESLGGNVPLLYGCSYAMTVYVFRRKATPSIMSPMLEL